MSVASEWARRHAQTMAVRPHFECLNIEGRSFFDDDDQSDKHEPETHLRRVGRVDERGNLYMNGVIAPSDACAFARWVLDTFSNPATLVSLAASPASLRAEPEAK